MVDPRTWMVSERFHGEPAERQTVGFAVGQKMMIMVMESLTTLGFEVRGQFGRCGGEGNIKAVRPPA